MKKLFTTLFACGLLLLNATPSLAAGQATLTLSPVTGTQKVDAQFAVAIHVNTAGTAVNTIKAYLTFDPKVLDVVSVSTTSSVATIFTENDPDNINGTLHITGAATGNGFTGADGLFATVNFHAKAAGTSTLTFTSDSRVISNLDNSDLLNFTGLQNGSYTVSAAGGTGATTTTTSTGSALPNSGSYSNTITLLLLALGLVGTGILVSKPSILAFAKSRQQHEKDILKKL